MSEKEVTESKEISVKLDAKSVGILKKVDSIHRSSMINLGLALIEKTGYYKTLCNEPNNKLETVVGLDALDSLDSFPHELAAQQTPAPKPPKKTTGWDDF